MSDCRFEAVTIGDLVAVTSGRLNCMTCHTNHDFQHTLEGIYRGHKYSPTFNTVVDLVELDAPLSCPTCHTEIADAYYECDDAALVWIMSGQHLSAQRGRERA